LSVGHANVNGLLLTSPFPIYMDLFHENKINMIQIIYPPLPQA